MGDGFEVTIPTRTNAPATPAYASLPPGAKRGMVVIHEVFGRQPEIDRVVDRFAKLGFAAVAPDLFAHGWKPFCIARALRATIRGEGDLLDQVRAAAAWLRLQTGLGDKQIGLIGFCMGGGFALASGAGFGAVSTNYGEMPPLPDNLGPVIGCYGGRDLVFGRTAPKLEAKLTERSIPHEIHTFPTAGHSFLTDGRHPVAAVLTKPLFHIRYDGTVAEEAWGRITHFLEEHLAAAPT
jgi:carboxymethylenebutenolidase